MLSIPISKWFWQQCGASISEQVWLDSIMHSAVLSYFLLQTRERCLVQISPRFWMLDFYGIIDFHLIIITFRLLLELSLSLTPFSIGKEIVEKTMVVNLSAKTFAFSEIYLTDAKVQAHAWNWFQKKKKLLANCHHCYKMLKYT